MSAEHEAQNVVSKHRPRAPPISGFIVQHFFDSWDLRPGSCTVSADPCAACMSPGAAPVQMAPSTATDQPTGDNAPENVAGIKGMYGRASCLNVSDEAAPFAIGIESEDAGRVFFGVPQIYAERADKRGNIIPAQKSQHLRDIHRVIHNVTLSERSDARPERRSR